MHGATEFWTRGYGVHDVTHRVIASKPLRLFGNYNGNQDGTFVSYESGYQFVENFTLNRGNHSIKLDVELLPNSFQERTRNLNETFTFAGLAANAIRGTVSPLQQAVNAQNRAVGPSTGLPYADLSNLAVIGAAPNGGPRYGGTANRSNPAFGYIYTTDLGGYSNYNGFVVQYTQRTRHGLSLQASCNYQNVYGPSYTSGSYFGVLTTPSNPARPSADEGSGDYSQPQRITFTGVYTPRLDTAMPQRVRWKITGI